MRVLGTVLLLMGLSVSMSESEESLGDSQQGSNDRRVTNNTEHEVIDKMFMEDINHEFTDYKKCLREATQKNDSSSVGGYNKREEAIIV